MTEDWLDLLELVLVDYGWTRDGEGWRNPEDVWIDQDEAIVWATRTAMTIPCL